MNNIVGGFDYRRDSGGLIDRSQPLRFTFDGVGYEGFAGDTLASALLANGVHLDAVINTIKKIDSVYDAYRTVPGGTSPTD